MKRMLTMLAVALLVVVLSAGSVFATAGAIKGTKHDLSSTGNQDIHSDTEDEICVFCHTPHNARVNVPLWNRQANPQSYQMYTSTTLDDPGETLTDSNISTLCLSCHDGTLALGAVQNNYGQLRDTTITVTSNTAGLVTDGKLSTTWTTLGTNLSNDHPVGVKYLTTETDLNQAADNKGPFIANPKVLVYGTDKKVECSSCHAVHGGTGANPFLRMSNAGSALCLECHKK